MRHWKSQNIIKKLTWQYNALWCDNIISNTIPRLCYLKHEGCVWELRFGFGFDINRFEIKGFQIHWF